MTRGCVRLGKLLRYLASREFLGCGSRGTYGHNFCLTTLGLVQLLTPRVRARACVYVTPPTESFLRSQQPHKEFRPCYGTGLFITVFTRAHHGAIHSVFLFLQRSSQGQPPVYVWPFSIRFMLRAPHFSFSLT